VAYEHLDEIYEAYLLGVLDRGDRAKVQEHLERDCPNCLEQLREATLSVYVLCQMARPVRPAAERRSQLLRRLRKK
jgi:hypothetical protein